MKRSSCEIVSKEQGAVIRTEHSEEPSDEALASAAQGGNSAAFDSLIRRHYGTVFAVAYARLGKPEAAEDLVQEVFLRAWLNIASLRANARFAPWVTLMARNLAVDWQRRGESRSRLVSLVPLEEHVDAMTDPGTNDPRDAASAQQERELAAKALALLPPDLREVAILHYTEGLSKSEISRRLGVHPSTIGRQLDAAVARMKDGLEVGLRRPASPARAPSRAPARAIAIIAAVAAMAPEAKAAVVTAAAQTTAGTVATVAPAAGGAAATVSATWTAILGGATTLASTNSFIVVAVATATLVGGIALYHATPSAALNAAAAAFSFKTQQGTPSADWLGPETVVHPRRAKLGETTRLDLKYGERGIVYFEDNVTTLRYLAGRFSKDKTLEYEQMIGSERQSGVNTSVPYQEEDVGYGIPMTDGIFSGSLIIRGEQGAIWYNWLSMEPKFTEQIKPIAAKFREGRINARTYRAQLVALLRNLKIGPSDSSFREKYYAELLKTAPIPN